MKKLVLFAVAFVAIFIFCGCGNKNKDNSKAEITECTKNMRRLVITLSRYAEKHGQLPFMLPLEKIIETDVYLCCPVSQTPYKIRLGGTKASYTLSTILLECQHGDKKLRANMFGRIDAIPKDHYSYTDNKMPVVDKFIIMK